MTSTRVQKRGFTLLEILVAIAAGLLLVLAISSLFASAGGTIATGRRLSEFSRTAAGIEQRLREDFRNITRDGYMLIRHAVADDGPTPGGTFLPWRVPAFPDDPNPRLRRVDEIMFFARGEFATARAPLAPGFVAEGNAARVYYGHGSIVDFAAGDALFIPEFDMGLGGTGGPGGGGTSLQVDIGLLGQPNGPNEFAGDWRLVRHQLVLAQPRSAEQVVPPSPFFDVPGDDDDLAYEILLSDGDRQIAMQPALSSLFRHVNLAIATPAIGQGGGSSMLREQSRYDRGRDMRVQSGIFDIATTDFREIRSWVMTMHNGTRIGPDYIPPPPPGNQNLDGGSAPIDPVPPYEFEREADFTDFPLKGLPRGYTPYIHAPFLDDPSTEAHQLLHNGIQAWMRNGMPTDGGTNTGGNQLGDDVEQQLNSIRMHVEESPPELLRVLDPNEFNPATLEAADRLNEQLLLTANNLGARIGEFMVEWTFGQTYLTEPYDATDPRNGELIWYGGHTLIDDDGDELADRAEFIEYLSEDNGASGFDRNAQPALGIHRGTGEVMERAGQSPPLATHVVHDALIHGPRTTGGGVREGPLYSYFGYDDPTYRPRLRTDDVDSVPWAWPTMLRITISLIDETDPTIEQSFQFVIELDSEN